MKKKLTLIAGLMAVIWVVPLYFVIINSAKDGPAVLNNMAGVKGANIGQFFENLNYILTNPSIDFVNAFIISIVVSLSSIVLITIIAAMAGWVLSRTKTKTSKVIYLCIIASMVIPFQVVMLPLVSLFKQASDVTHINLIGTPLGLIIAHTGFSVAFTIFLFHGFVKSIPIEIEEAAYIDGASKGKIFFEIVLPCLKPIVITGMILNGIFIWNDFLLPLMLLGQAGHVQTVPIAVSNFIGSFVKQWQYIMISLILTITPVMIIFMIGQKYIVKGMTMGANK